MKPFTKVAAIVFGIASLLTSLVECYYLDIQSIEPNNCIGKDSKKDRLVVSMLKLTFVNLYVEVSQRRIEESRVALQTVQRTLWYCDLPTSSS